MVLLLFAFCVSFFFIAMGRYSEVLGMMTPEIGILKVLGTSTGYLLRFLGEETLLISLAGTVSGVVATYAARWFVASFFPGFMTLEIVYRWWPIAGVSAAVGPLAWAMFAPRRSVKEGLVYALAAEA